MNRSAIMLAAMALAACKSSAGPAPSASSSASTSTSTRQKGQVEARPYGLAVPNAIDRSKPLPLLLVLHGYGADGAGLARGWGFAALADAKGMLVAWPDGTPDSSGKRFWNATDACCDFEGRGVDDVAYLRAVLDDVAARFPVDPKRVFVVGFSNGGFMAHRLACELGARVAAIASVGGATWKDAARCVQHAPVSVLEVHGDADAIVKYDGGVVPFGAKSAYPSVLETVAASAAIDRCTGALAPAGPPRHFDAAQSRDETIVQKVTGCPAGFDVELWTMRGSPHVARVTPAWSEALVGWLLAHGRS